ncbi:MAG: hypothetical protein PGN26_14260 [Xylophilus ampelinus]
MAVARRQQDRQAGMAPADLAAQLDAAHAGQHHVGEHHVETFAAAADRVQGLRAAGREHRQVAQGAQRLHGETAHAGMVLDHQHAHAAPVGRRRGIGGGRRRRRRRHAGQVQDEARALADPALDHHLAARLARETVDLRQPEPGPLAHPLGGEEGFEDPVDLRGRDAAAGVDDRDGHAFLPAVRGRGGQGGRAGGDVDADGQPPLAVHGVARVDRHVHQRGVELAGVGTHEAGRVRQPGDDLDARARQRGHHVRHRADAVGHGEHLRLERLPAGEGQQLPGEPSRPVHRVGNGPDAMGAARLREVGPPEQVRGRLDDGEQIVEIVGDAAGQLPDRLQLLRLAQGFLHVREFRLLRDPPGHVDAVLGDADDVAPVAAQGVVADLPDRDRDVRMAERLDDREGLAGQRPREEAADRRGLLRQEQVGEHVAGLHPVAVDPEELVLERPVEGQHPEVTVERAHRLDVRLHDLAEELQLRGPFLDPLFEPGIECAQPLFGAAAFDGRAGVAGHGAHEIHFGGRPCARRGVDRVEERDQAAVFHDRLVDQCPDPVAFEDCAGGSGARVGAEVVDGEGRALRHAGDRPVQGGVPRRPGPAVRAVPGRIPRKRRAVPGHGDVARAVHPERAAHDVRRRARQFGGIAFVAEAVEQLEQGGAAPVPALVVTAVRLWMVCAHGGECIRSGHVQVRKRQMAFVYERMLMNCGSFVLSRSPDVRFRLLDGSRRGDKLCIQETTTA